MVKFTEENKKVQEFNSNYFSYGVHKVQIVLIEQGTTDSDKDYVEFTVCDPADGDKTDTARVWFSTDNAVNYSFNTIRSIYVHNAPESKKKDAGDSFDAVADLDELVALITDKLIGGECWFTKYMDPTRTYMGKDNIVRKSVNKNIYGYEPKLNEALMPKQADENGDEVVDLNSLDSTAPLGGKDVTNTKEGKGIPEKW